MLSMPDQAPGREFNSDDPPVHPEGTDMIAFRVLVISLIALETSLEAFARVSEVTVIISLAVETRYLGSASSDKSPAVATATVVAPMAAPATHSPSPSPKSCRLLPV